MKIKPRVLMACLLALIAMIFVWVYITTKEGVLEGELKKVSVVVAVDEILPNQPIEDSLVQVVSVPLRYVQPGAATATTDVVGDIASVGIMKGAQILRTNLRSAGRGRGLAFKVPVGKRAVTIAVNDVNGVASLVQPGNYVDIVGVFKFGSFAANAAVNPLSIPPNQQSQAMTLYQNVWVLATGRDAGEAVDLTAKQKEKEKQRMEALAQPNAMPKSEAVEGYKTVTVALTPDQAQDLILAQHLGELSLVLRSFREKDTVVELKNSTAVSVLKVDVPVVPRATPVWHEIRGGQ
jgi:pilus assembly protein CpaB